MATISIVAVVDVVAALADDTLDGNHYLFDDNRHLGSSGEGTQELKTKVEAGDQLVWTTTSLESEAYAMVEAIDIDPKFADFVEVAKKVYAGTSVPYWVGDVKKAPLDAIPYTLRFKLGSRPTLMAGSTSPSLIG